MTTTLTLIVIFALLWLAWPRSPKVKPYTKDGWASTSPHWDIDGVVTIDSVDHAPREQLTTATLITPKGIIQMPLKWKVYGPQVDMKLEYHP